MKILVISYKLKMNVVFQYLAHQPTLLLKPNQQSLGYMTRISTNLIFILTLVTLTYALNFPLGKSRQTCLIVTQGSYQFQYVVSGHSQSQVRCVISEMDKIISQITRKSEYEGEFTVTQSNASICFSSLDTLTKSVSVDFLRTDDPLRGLIQNEEKMKVHEKLYKSFQELQKVYRDQHFFLERNYIHSILLKQTEIVVVFFLLLKIVVAFICSFFQLYFVKNILQKNFNPLPSEEPQ